VTDGGDVIAVVPRSETSLSQNEPPPPRGARAERWRWKWDAGAAKAAGAPLAGSGSRARSSRGFRRPAGRHGACAVMQAGARVLRPRQEPLGAGRHIALQRARPRYDLSAPVTIPDKERDDGHAPRPPIPGEAISLFEPDDGVPDSASHPFRVARFEQDGGLLERGPLATSSSSRQARVATTFSARQ